MFVAFNLLYHLRSIQRNLPRFDATGNIDVNTFILNVWGRGKFYQFVPQFIRKNNGKMTYSLRMPDDPRGFVGWVPYFNKHWDAALDKLAFKEYCAARGLLCPAYSKDKPDIQGGFLVKPRKASFGSGIRGPFRSFDAENPAHRLQEGEYYDLFVSGSMGK